MQSELRYSTGDRKRNISCDQALGRQGHSREGSSQEQSQVAALGGRSPQNRGRGQETGVKVKLPFSGTSQVPGAAGNTVRIFLLIRKKKKINPDKDCRSAVGSSPRVAWKGVGLGFQPRDAEFCPEAWPLPASLAPGVHAEAGMWSLSL